MRIQAFLIYIEITDWTDLGPFKHNASHGIRLLNRGYHSIPFYVIIICCVVVTYSSQPFKHALIKYIKFDPKHA